MNVLDKLNIKNIFTTSTNIDDISINTLNIKTLFKKSNKYNHHVNTRLYNNFDIDSLIETRKMMRITLLKSYSQILDICIQTINHNNNLGKTDTIVDLPLTILGCINYNVDECREYIINKLNMYKLDTLKINNNKLFISWYYLELNLSKE
jgi:hypothetical protein